MILAIAKMYQKGVYNYLLLTGHWWDEPVFLPVEVV